MDCVNHPGVTATAFCQNCGKALCVACVRTAPGGQVLCEPCFASWQSYQQPFTPVNTGSPNPAAAAVLGLIPGVGAMYNGQFFKGLIHVVIFAVLVSMAHISGIFGIFIPAWIIYQSFEASGPVPPTPPPPGAWQPPYTGGPYQTPYQAPYQTPYAPPAAGPIDPNAPPQPIPPDPSAYWHPGFWRRGAPVGAIVLIALGVLFLLGQLDIFNGRLLEFTWPLALIGLGVWLVVRRLGESQGGPK